MPGDADRPLKIGEVARLLQVSEAALRFYERAGLVKPARTAGGTRLYHPHHVRRLRAIIALARVGIDLDDIRKVMLARESGTTGAQASARVREVLRKYLEDVRRRQALLREVEAGIVQAMKLVEGCRHCGNLPDSRHCPDCPVNRHRAESPFLDLFWE